MADRTSARVFGKAFMLLAEEPFDKQRVIDLLWKETRGFDFSPYQMCCDEALMKLGLARKGVDPDYPSEGETILYGYRE